MSYSICNDWIYYEFCYLDTETTGLADKAEIVEIAVVAASGEPIFETLVKPKRALTRKLTGIHGISNEMVANAPNWNDIYDSLCLHLTGRTFVAYNADYDRRLIAQTCALYHLPELRMNWVCAQEMYMNYKGTTNRISLEKACIEQEVYSTERHRAKVDADNVRRLVRKISERDTCEIPYLQEQY